jgi:hypothetical protein
MNETQHGTRGASAAEGPGPEHRSPILVALLALFTFGIYALYWLWQTSQEADAFDPRGDSPYDLARWSVPVSAIGVVGSWAVMIFAFVALGASDLASGALFGGGSILVAVGFALFGLLGLAGGIGNLVAAYRIWGFVERHERAIGVRDPLSPKTMIGIVIGIIVLSIIPIVNLLAGPVALVGGGYIYYRTQQGLNRVGEAARGDYTADQAWQQGAGTAVGTGAGTSASPDPAEGGGTTGGGDVQG